jgi:hypothetical protein
MSDAELAAIRERCEAATEGPWRRITLDIPWNDVVTDDQQTVVANSWDICEIATRERIVEPKWTLQHDIADAEFIAAARTDVPALLDEVDRLRGLLRDAYEHLDTHSAGCRLCDGYGDPCTCGLPDLRRRIEVEIAKKGGGTK